MCDDVRRGSTTSGGGRRTPTTSAAAATGIPARPTSKWKWTLEAAADPRRIVRDPDPKSRTGAVRIIGYSSGAGFVITIIATGTTHAGATAWKSSGADLRDYEGQE